MIIENEYLRAEFTNDARISSLINKTVGCELITEPTADPFMLILASDRCKENIVWGHEQSLTVEATADTLTYRAERLKIDNGRADSGYAELALTLKVKLEGERLIFTSTLDNRSGMLVTDVEYPRIGKIKSLGDGKPTLYIPTQPGRLIHNIGETLSNAHRHRENGSNTLKSVYPGEAMLGFYALLDRTSSLFMSSFDPDFIECEQKIHGDPEDFGALTLSMDRFPCVGDGIFESAPIVLSLYKGDWYRGADEYADFIKDYRSISNKPDWAREMLGYFLVINRQQFGCEMWSYDTLPKLWELAKAHGCDTLGLFGWYDSGHDNNYPDLEVSESLGGEDALKRGIKTVQSDGGHVTLYYQGHLIDPCSEFANTEIGKKVTAKNIWGNNFLDFYSKSHKSDFLANFSHKAFHIACPSAKEWRELMLERERWLADFDPDGWLYDQIGGCGRYICFDETHDHGKCHGSSFPNGRRKLLADLQNGAKAIGSEKIFMSEHICDVYSCYLDAVHGIGVMPSVRGDRKNPIGGEKGSTQFPEVFRYICPDTVITLRNPNPYIDRRAVNFAFLYGYALEMELRYLADRDDILADKYADKREWAQRVSKLRKKYVKLTAHGRFIDEKGFTNPDPMLYAKGFALEDGRLAVTLWNDSDEAKIPELKINGRRLVSFETVDNLTDSLGVIAPDSVAIAIYE